MGFVVGIDGTAGSGKGTVTKNISNKLGLINVDEVQILAKGICKPGEEEE